MNGAYVHLAFNHIPVVAMPFAFLLFAVGLWRKSKNLVGAGFVGLIIIALATIVAFRSGGGAAHLIINLPGIVRAQIHEHAEAADWAFWMSVILGIMAVGGIWILKTTEEIPRKWTLAISIGTLFASVVFVRVAHLGGLIRHPEIESSFQPPAPPAVKR